MQLLTNCIQFHVLINKSI